jgi:hypothetical protein
VEDQLLLAGPVERGRRRRLEVLHRGRHEVEDLSLLPATLLVEVLEQHVAGHAEQEVAEAGRLADPPVGLDAAQEGPLDQVVRVDGRLVVEEPGHRVVVPLEQLRTGSPIAAGPRLEELTIEHRRERITRRFRSAVVRIGP